MDMTESRRFTRTAWPQIEQDVAAAIDIVARVNNEDGHFDMQDLMHGKGSLLRRTEYPCGTPACALGHIRSVDAELFKRINIKFISPLSLSEWDALFSCKLGTTIHTPFDWCAHATQWLRSRGYEYSPEIV